MTASFTSQLQRFAKKTETRVDQLHRLVVFHIYRSVVMKTPVDTGWARASWFVTSGAPASGTAPQPARVKGAAPMAPPTFAAAARAHAGAVSYITNNVPYIVFLEHGHSQAQAPHGMMRLAVLETKAQFGKLVREVNP